MDAAAVADKIWRMQLEARVAQPITEAEAVRLARSSTGRKHCSALPGEYDDNFHLTSADGQAFVLKDNAPGAGAFFIDLQCHALRHLRSVRRNCSARVIPVPRRTVHFDCRGDGCNRLVWLLTF